MITLKALTDKLVAVLSAAPATTQLTIAAYWHDITSVPTYSSSSQAGVTNSTTQVDLVSGPGVDNQRIIDGINVFNNDTATATIKISYSDDGTLRTLWTITLVPGGYATYTRGAGLQKFDATGTLITSGEPGANGADGLVSLKTAELDFGSTPVRSQTFTVTDATVSPTSKLIASQSGAAATGRDSDENETDALILRCAPGSGSFTVYADALLGPVSGKFKINYIVT